MAVEKLFECIIQGEVSTDNYDGFRERVNGLCSSNIQPEEFSHKEFIYRFDSKCPDFVAGMSTSELRARQIINSSNTSKNDQRIWELVYNGKWERKQASQGAKLVPFRSRMVSACSSNCTSFLSLIGLRSKYALFRNGLRWNLTNGIILEVFTLKPMPADQIAACSLDTFRAIVPEAYLVQFQIVARAEEIDDASNVLRNFCVHLEKYFVELKSEEKKVSISTATLAAESRKKRPHAFRS